MHARYLTSIIVALLLSVSPRAGAQTSADVSGHWEGAIHVPGREIAIEIDFGRGAAGELIGAFNNPADHLTGFPLSNVVVDGRSVRFAIVAGAGGGPFKGVVSDDGRTIDGDFTATTPQGPTAFPVTLSRTGDAHLQPPPTNAAVGKELEGEWRGSIDVNGTPTTVTLTLTNHPDGTSTGTAWSSGGNASIPITTISQKGTSVRLEMNIIGGAYAATLNADGTELVGTWTQGSSALPLAFTRQR